MGAGKKEDAKKKMKIGQRNKGRLEAVAVLLLLGTVMAATIKLPDLTISDRADAALTRNAADAGRSKGEQIVQEMQDKYETEGCKNVIEPMNHAARDVLTCRDNGYSIDDKIRAGECIYAITTTTTATTLPPTPEM